MHIERDQIIGLGGAIGMGYCAEHGSDEPETNNYPGRLRADLIITRLVEKETLEKMGAKARPSQGSESVVEGRPDDPASVFGAGHALDNMTLEIAQAPLTTGRVVSVLPWLPSRDKNLRPSDAKFSQDVLPVERIGRPSFIRTRP